MVKSGSSFPRVRARDIARLKRRVQALEKAVWPTGQAREVLVQPKCQVISVDEKTARRAAIEAFEKEERSEWLRQFPYLLEARRKRLEKLNRYLRERGLDPEPDADG